MIFLFSKISLNNSLPGAYSNTNNKRSYSFGEAGNEPSLRVQYVSSNLTIFGWDDVACTFTSRIIRSGSYVFCNFNGRISIFFTAKSFWSCFLRQRCTVAYAPLPIRSCIEYLSPRNL